MNQGRSPSLRGKTIPQEKLRVNAVWTPRMKQECRPWKGNQQAHAFHWRQEEDWNLHTGMYLQINHEIYIDDKDKIAFILSYTNDKEALRWKQAFLRLIDIEGELEFPSLKDFLSELLNYFQLMNSHQDAAHQLALLKQGNQTAEEVITDFQLLTSLAGYSSKSMTSSDHLHLIEKLWNVLNPSLVKKVMLLDNPPTTINTWMQKAIMVDANYRMTMEVLGWRTEMKKTEEARKPSYTDYFMSRKPHNKRDPNAMDAGVMSTEKRTFLMHKGAHFICEEPGHLAKDHQEHEWKKKAAAQGSTTKGQTSIPQKKRSISKIHTLLLALSAEETKELLALQQKEEKKKEDDDEDF